MLDFISGLVLYFQPGTQNVAPVTEQTRNERLPELWFADIPQCTLQCIYPLALECGCAYSDFKCICESISEITEDEKVESCISLCPHNQDQRWAPSRILDFCGLLDVDVYLPEYMGQFAALHRRQAVDSGSFWPSSVASYSDYPASDHSYEPTSSYNGTTVITTSTSTAVEQTATNTNTDTVTHLITSAPTYTNPSSNNGSGESPSSSSSSGLSTGAKAGIGVGIPIVAIILVLGVFWFWRRRKASQDIGSDNIPEVGQQPKKFVPFGGVDGRFEVEGGSLPAEADGNPLNEADSRSILPSPENQNQLTTSPIYELSGNSAAVAPPPAALVPQRRNESFNGQYSETSSTNISRKAVGSHPLQAGSELESGKVSSPSKPASDVVDNVLASPRLSEKINTTEQLNSEQNEQETESNARTSASIEQNDLQQLEQEIARVRAQRERLQHLQMLEEREEQLKSQIAARKTADSTE
ncbi:hypothetical protein BGW36DRAFT_382728 [Talaromyces proteolyticus]|uniref:CFEM domain-containing protein n=1 Tax=Talaromyces proteolyticus TaxID=1131652 RepID=A0AAD4KMQ6_9EURO|nr:uncharacterized protein BGW36DRAFT_382728 [Talaromyces proteolyticus]KAH8695460.1 hypothetical protein BGW36DRAFT_382728 [Talaromyces proteolyticus]